MMMRGLKWVKMVTSGARLNYIKYLFKLFLLKKSKQNNSNQNQFNLTKTNENKIERNKFGFPLIK